MKRTLCILSTFVCLLVLAPAALADGVVQEDPSVDQVTQATTDSTPAQTSTETPSTSTETPSTSTETPSTTTETSTSSDSSCTSSCDPPPCTENCDPPPCTVNCAPCTVNCIPGDPPCIDAVACDDVPVAGEGRGPGVAVAGGAALPFTGIEDVLLPLFMGALALLAGVIAYRFAAVRDMVARARAVAIAERERRQGTGYSYAMRNIDADQQAVAFWRSRSNPAA